MGARAATALAAAVLVGLCLAPHFARASDAPDACAAAGDARLKSASKSRCEGFWNIYASIPGGEAWWFDNKDGDDPKAAALQRAIDAKAALVQQQLKRCRVTTFVSLSDWFDNLKGDLVVVHSNAHASEADAATELARARACGVRGYTRFSPFMFVGRD